MMKLENVSYAYKKSDKNVLKNISAIFENGKLSSVVGPSGSGKTTLLSIMAGLDSPGAGVISVDGEPLAEMNLDRYRRERVSMIFQAFQLFPLLTALENVCYPMLLVGTEKKESAERAKKYLESVGIDGETCNRYPSSLSGGEQQRVAVARSLATGAKLILADEPTGNLDVANGDAVIEILRGLAHNDGYCVIVVTHDLDIAAASDVVFRMSDGVLVRNGA
jgi:putative ABC transport system ATP-binding protein